MKTPLAIAALFLLLQSCKKEKEPPFLSRKDIPTAPGSNWRYRCKDLHLKLEYDVKHQIEWTENLSGDTQIIHYSLYAPDNSLQDSAIGILTKTGYIYLGVRQQNYSRLGNFSIVFPLTQNIQWAGTDSNDTMRMGTYADQFNILGKTYKGVFYVNSFYLKGLEQRQNEIYLSPSIGVIAKNLFFTDGDSRLEQKRSYHLIDYHLQ